jgi:endonuclease/exonuclease/phosphatase family metal-dependent hydrolase
MTGTKAGHGGRALLCGLFLFAGMLVAAAESPLTIMSFNVRYGTAGDGENRWELRRPLLMDVLSGEGADVIGLQEALHFQIEQMVQDVPGYAFVGVSRDDGRTAGEYSAILYRRERLQVIESGTFWFSNTPARPASTSWGNRIPRICTWGRFSDAGGRRFYVFNVHLDHESQPSRERSVRLLAERIRTRRGRREPVIVTGDFNADEQNPAIRWLLGARVGGIPRRGPRVPLVDTFRRLHPDARGVGTFTGFEFGRIDERKIDYVLTTTDVTVLDARIVHTSRGGRYPSDHFPVVARVSLPAGGR